MTEISDLKLFLGTILDSFMEKGYVPQDTEERDLVKKDPVEQTLEGKDLEEKDFKEKAREFVSNHKNWVKGATLLAGFALGPPIAAGVIGLLGFGSSGIAAGSIAAWMMSLHRGAVAAGSLVSVL